MGVFKPFSCSSYDEISSFSRASASSYKKLPNPNPFNYTIEKYIEIDNYTVLQLRYHDCTNYEGKKILVYKDCNVEDLKRQKHLDPHFSNNKKYHSPIARFEPTDDGWEMAIKLIESINKYPILPKTN